MATWSSPSLSRRGRQPNRFTSAGIPLTATPRSRSAFLWLGNALPRLGAAVAAESGSALRTKRTRRQCGPLEGGALRSLAAPAPATCNLFLQIGLVSDTLAFSATTADEPHLRARTPQPGRVPLRDQGQGSRRLRVGLGKADQEAIDRQRSDGSCTIKQFVCMKPRPWRRLRVQTRSYIRAAASC